MPQTHSAGRAESKGKPETVCGELAELPAALRPLTKAKRWVVWKREKNRSGKWTKVPYRARDPRVKASTSNPTTWSSYPKALATVKAGKADGLGFVLSPADELPSDIGAIDLDKCRDKVTGAIAPWAQELIDETGSYVEVTVSGTGLRVIGIVEGTSLHENFATPDDGKIEFYRGATRFITVSGLQFSGADELENIDELIDNSYTKFRKKEEEKPKASTSSSLNTVALANLNAWVPELFPGAHKSSNGSYRISSLMLGRDLEEDLSISPKGIKDFGVHDMGDRRNGKRTAIDVVMMHGDMDFAGACTWLGSRLGVSPESAPEFSESMLALRFAERHAHELRYVDAWGRWLRWDGTRWEHERTLLAFDLSHRICREAAQEFRQVSNSSPRPIASAKTVAAVVNLSRTDRRIAETTDTWDADPWLLNTPGGVVDLRTGKIRPAEPDDYMAKITAVAPDEDCSIKLWLKVLKKAMGNDDEMVSYLQRMFGYCLTGVTIAETFFFFHGEGANGKSKIIEAIGGAMGDYRIVTPMETFLASRHGETRHPTEIADLAGARLVTAVETDEGRRWDAAKIKSLTGGDKAKGRFMRQDFFDFTPQFKPLVHGNKKPRLRSVDEAIRRRFQMIAFEVIVPPAERDPNLGEKLKREWPGILAWAIAGCAAWQAFGLAPPNKVAKATDAYFAGEDAVGRWIDERCTLDRNAKTKRTFLWGDWKVWAEAAGEYVGRDRDFYGELEKRKELRPKTVRGVHVFQGIEFARGHND